MLEELQTCLAKMSKQKASGPDNILTMLWKDQNFHTELLYFCNEILEGNTPLAFSKSNMITILRKCDLSQPSNYRGITLTSITSKVYNSLLLIEYQITWNPYSEGIKMDFIREDPL